MASQFSDNVPTRVSRLSTHNATSDKTLSQRLQKEENGQFAFTLDEKKNIIRWMVRNRAVGCKGRKHEFEALLTSLGYNDASLSDSEKFQLRTRVQKKITYYQTSLVAKEALICKPASQQHEVDEGEYAPWTSAWFDEAWDGQLTRPSLDAVDSIEAPGQDQCLDPADSIEAPVQEPSDSTEAPDEDERFVVESPTESDDTVAAPVHYWYTDIPGATRIRHLPSINHHIPFHIFNLSHDNYPRFMTQIESILRTEGIWGVVTGTTTLPTPPVRPLGTNTIEDRELADLYPILCGRYEEKKMEFIGKKNKCLGWLFLTMGKEIREEMMAYNEPTEVLEKLRDEFDAEVLGDEN